MADGLVQTGPDRFCGPKTWASLKIWTMYYRTKGQIPKRPVKGWSLTGPQQTSPKIGTGPANGAISECFDLIFLSLGEYFIQHSHFRFAPKIKCNRIFKAAPVSDVPLLTRRVSSALPS